MAVIHTDGFDFYANPGQRYEQTRYAYIGTQYARPGSAGQGLRTQNDTGGAYVRKFFGANYTQGCIGAAVYPYTRVTWAPILGLLDGTQYQISLSTDGSGRLYVVRGSTTLATGTTVLSVGVWYYVELNFVIDPTAGSIEVRLNGASEIPLVSDINTRSTANTWYNGFQLGGTNNGEWWYDDVYVLDTSTSPNTTFLGPIQVVALRPSEPGTYAQWTPNGGTNLGCVSDSFPDGDNTFVQSSTPNQIDTFKLSDLPTTSGSVYAVNVINVARTTASNTIAPVIRIGTTDYVGQAQALANSYTFVSQIFDNSPDTGNAWTAAEVAAMESGYKLIS